MDNLENTKFNNTTDGVFGDTKIDWEKSLVYSSASDTSAAADAAPLDFTSLSNVIFTED